MIPRARSAKAELQRRRRALRALLAPLLLLSGGSAPALAAGPILFHSPLDNGVNPGCPRLNECVLGGTQSDPLYLWIDPGSDAGAGFCGNVCGVDAVLEIEGGTFSGFVPEPGVIHNPGCQAGTGGESQPPCLLPAATDRLIVNASFAALEAQSGVRRLGTLLVSTPQPPLLAAVSVNGVELVDGALQSKPLPTEIIAVPEPGQGLLLASGALLMAALHLGGQRWRRARD
jgi:hypothetical protein